jgi:hypothetical protein
MNLMPPLWGFFESRGRKGVSIASHSELNLVPNYEMTTEYTLIKQVLLFLRIFCTTIGNNLLGSSKYRHNKKLWASTHGNYTDVKLLFLRATAVGFDNSLAHLLKRAI